MFAAQTIRLGFAAISLLLFQIPALGQVTAGVSGVPGDGIPDVYFFPYGGQVVGSEGLIRYRPPGTLTVDVDGTDMVYISIGSEDVTDSCEGPYGPLGYVCGYPHLIRSDNPPVFQSTLEYGFTGRTMFWNQVDPENSIGFYLEGVVGEVRDGFFLSVDHGLAYYEPGSEFDSVFAGPKGGSWEVRYESFEFGDFLTNVTIVVPEPSTWLLCVLALVFMTRSFGLLPSR